MEARRKSTESDLIIDVFFTNVIRGKDGITPHIGSNKHWYLGDRDMGVVAEGKNGKDGENGATPVIGSNGNWWIGGEDTGKSSNASIPSGIITMWSGSIDSIPEGWALCDGGGVLSNGGRIPDLRGRFIVGYDSEDTDYNSIGKKGGEKKHQLSIAEMPSHNHFYLYHINGAEDYNKYSNKNNVDGIDKGMPTSKEGGDRPHENRPPYYTLAYIIKL